MTEYLEREAKMQNESICRSCFHSYVCEQFDEHRDSNNKKCHFFSDHYMPAADVVEVVHGHWISQQEAETINDYGKAYCCSICGHCDWDCTESESFNYCPHCGAKMGEERRSE